IDYNTVSTTSLMYLAFHSKETSISQITDDLLRVVRHKLQAIFGVAKAKFISDKSFAMRIRLDRHRMAALGVTASDVRDALLNNNYLAGVGQTKGAYVSIDFSVTTDISQEEDFMNLVVYEKNGVLVRLKDVAEPKLGVENYDSE